MARRPVAVNDILDGHVRLDRESFDRIKLNAYVLTVQVLGFRARDLGLAIPVLTILEKRRITYWWFASLRAIARLT
jgi:hypothetical protein